jgi:hypothetical protein
MNLSSKIPAAGVPMSYAQTGLKMHSRHKKLLLTTKSALVIQMDIV